MVNTEIEKAYALQQSGNLNQALSIYNQIIKVSPNNDVAYYLAAIVYKNCNRLDTAAEYLKKAININSQAQYYKELGFVNYLKKDYQGAFNCFEEYLIVEPNDIEVLSIVGDIYVNTNAIDEAIQTFEKIFLLDNSNADNIFDLGIAYLKRNDLNSAFSAFQKLIEMQPHNWQGYFYCALILKELNDASQAELYYKKALELNPDEPEINYKLGILYHLCNKPNLAIEQYKETIRKNPDQVDVYVNLGSAYRCILELDNEIKTYRQALGRNLKSEKLFFNLGTALNTIGNYEEGMPYFEHRNGVFEHHKLKYPQEKYPKWDATKPTQGKTILVTSTAPNFSYGDTVMFARYLPKIAEMGAKVICQPQKIVRSLLEQSDLRTTYIDINQKDIACDYQIPIMSLPWAFKTTIDTIPFKSRYLNANEDKIKIYKDKYFDNDKFKIGICWRGGLGFDSRSLELNNFKFLEKLSTVKIYSLQKGFGLDELSKIQGAFDVVDLGSTFNDFSDSAAALKCLDLVITIDTAMSHLAGGLNVPAFVLLPYMPDWRWGLNSSKSDWYDSIRLFRQKRPQDWSNVFEEVETELKTLI